MSNNIFASILSHAPSASKQTTNEKGDNSQPENMFANLLELLLDSSQQLAPNLATEAKKCLNNEPGLPIVGNVLLETVLANRQSGDAAPGEKTADCSLLVAMETGLQPVIGAEKAEPQCGGDTHAGGDVPALRQQNNTGTQNKKKMPPESRLKSETGSISSEQATDDTAILAAGAVPPNKVMNNGQEIFPSVAPQPLSSPLQPAMVYESVKAPSANGQVYPIHLAANANAYADGAKQSSEIAELLPNGSIISDSKGPAANEQPTPIHDNPPNTALPVTPKLNFGHTIDGVGQTESKELYSKPPADDQGVVKPIPIAAREIELSEMRSNIPFVGDDAGKAAGQAQEIHPGSQAERQRIVRPVSITAPETNFPEARTGSPPLVNGSDGKAAGQAQEIHPGPQAEGPRIVRPVSIATTEIAFPEKRLDSMAFTGDNAGSAPIQEMALPPRQQSDNGQQEGIDPVPAAAPEGKFPGVKASPISFAGKNAEKALEQSSRSGYYYRGVSSTIDKSSLTGFPASMTQTMNQVIATYSGIRPAEKQAVGSGVNRIDSGPGNIAEGIAAELVMKETTEVIPANQFADSRLTNIVDDAGRPVMVRALHTHLDEKLPYRSWSADDKETKFASLGNNSPAKIANLAYGPSDNHLTGQPQPLRNNAVEKNIPGGTADQHLSESMQAENQNAKPAAERIIPTPQVLTTPGDESGPSHSLQQELQPVNHSVIENNYSDFPGNRTVGQEVPLFQHNASSTGTIDSEPVMRQNILNKEDIVFQVVEQARLITRPHNSEMTIKLKPEHLGDLSLKVVVDNGVVSASFHSENPEVRSIIEASVGTLKQELLHQGLKVDYVGISAGLEGDTSSNYRGNYHPPKQPKNGSRRNVADMPAISELVPLLSGQTAIDYRV